MTPPIKNPTPLPTDVEEAAKLKKEIADRYDAGETIRELMLAYNQTSGVIISLIQQGGGRIRQRGGRGRASWSAKGRRE